MDRLSCTASRAGHSDLIAQAAIRARHHVSSASFSTGRVLAVLLASTIASVGPAKAATLNPDFFATYAVAVAAGLPPATLPSEPALTPLSRLAPHSNGPRTQPQPNP